MPLKFRLVFFHNLPEKIDISVNNRYNETGRMCIIGSARNILRVIHI